MARPGNTKSVETLTHDAARRKNIPTAEYQSVLPTEQQQPKQIRYPRPDAAELGEEKVGQKSRPRPAARLARQGRAGLERPRRLGATAVHPGEGASQGADRRPPAQHQGAQARGRADYRRPLRRFQRHPQGRRQDRLLPARPELDQPHDPGRFAAGHGQPRRARGAARQGAVHLPRSALRDQVQQQFSVEHHQPRREGWQCESHHARAGAGQGVSRYLARRDSQLPDLPARSAHRGAGSADRIGVDLRADRR
jgi:hypothetical protein